MATKELTKEINNLTQHITKMLLLLVKKIACEILWLEIAPIAI